MKHKILIGKKLEWFVFILFVAVYVVITIFHEPWFDEAQAWQIAKCANWKEILFEIPHLEGHPPLWHLILMIPAKLGVPFEIGLKSVGLIISTFATYLMLFQSKLPRLVRILIPFTYFFFYQYGIVVRPYGLMLVVLLMVGMNLTQEQNHPWRLTLLLGLLCCTSAYGILFAGGISICIVWDIYREKGICGLLKELVRDSRTKSLLLLLIFAIILILQILPSNDAYAINIHGDTSLAIRLLCAFLTFPVDCFLSTSTWFGIEQVSMQAMRIPITEFMICSVIGFILWFVIICASSKRNLKYLVVPYLLYVFFAASIYFSTHHMGIVFLLFLFWAEHISREGDGFEIGKHFVSIISKTDHDKRLLRNACLILLGACIAVPLFWTTVASIHEYQHEYCFARSMANFIKENGIDKALILCQWNDEGSTYPQSQGNKDYINTYVVGTAVPLNAYFDHNIILNLNNGIDSEAYVHHRIDCYKESREMVEKWAKKGIPEVLIGLPDLELVYGDEVTCDDYSCVYSEEAGFIWKSAINKGTATIYIRNDLLSKYSIEPVDDTALRYWKDGIPISDEMREQYENGVPIEEILNPYLNTMFDEEK